MKAPKYLAAEMLGAALQEALETLEDPVEGLEITEQGVIAWAAGRFILMTCRRDNGYAEDGKPLLGTGTWSVRYVHDCDASFRRTTFAPVRLWRRRWRQR